MSNSLIINQKGKSKMALPTTRRQLKDWVLTKLGAPVIDINISPEQCEDRLSEALDYFKQYHFDGVQDIYLQHKISGSKINFASAVTAEFQTNEKIIGLTSGAETKFFDKAGDNLSIRVYDTKKDNQYANFIQFLPGETIKGESTNTVAVLAATNPFVAGDIDRHYLPLGDDIIAISHLLKLDTGYPGAGMWNVKYQFYLNNLPHLISTDIISYDMFRRHLSLLDFELNAQPRFDFNQITGRLNINTDWGNQIKIDDTVVVKAWKALNPSDYPKVYSNYFVREYAYLLFKMQWGNNLKKYDGVALMGGVTLNGQKIYDEAVTEMEKLEVRLQKEFQTSMGYIWMG